MKNTMGRLYSNRAAAPNYLRFLFGKAIGTPIEKRVRLPIMGLETIIYVNPLHIQKRFGPQHKSLKYTYLLTAGDWDMTCDDINLEAKSKFQTIEQLLSGMPVEQTREFLQFADHLKPGEKRQGKTRQEYYHYLEGMREMYRNIVEAGEFDPAIALDDPIKVGITRDEQIIKLSNGNHRLAIAHYAKLKSIPVNVRLIHASLSDKIIKPESSLQSLGHYIKSIEAKYAKAPDA